MRSAELHPEQRRQQRWRRWRHCFLSAARSSWIDPIISTCSWDAITRSAGDNPAGSRAEVQGGRATVPDLLIRVQQHAVGHAPRLADQLPPRMPAAEAPWPTQRRLRCPHCRVATFSVATLAKRTRLDQLDQMTDSAPPTTATAPALPLHRPTSLALEPYAVQEQQWWPASGRHILASATADTIVVYQVGENHMMHECAEGRPEAAVAAWGCCEALLAAHVCCCRPTRPPSQPPRRARATS